MSKVQRVTTQSADGVITERPANAPSDKQVWLYKKLLKEAGKLPPFRPVKPGQVPLPEEEPF
jgi:hypothetical protein